MGSIRAFLLIFAVFVVMFATRIAKADCTGYSDNGSISCSGANGCKSQWEMITCWFGCTSGTCNPDGNTTECCGAPHDYAQVYPDGGRGCECGDVRVHARASHVNLQHRAELLQGYTPGLIYVECERELSAVAVRIRHQSLQPQVRAHG